MPAPAPAVPAATVVLLRDAEGSQIETFLLRRPAGGAFAGAHVFPGGRVDEADRDPGWTAQCDGVEQLVDRLAAHLAPADARAHAVAAVREVFEESGILLGRVPYESGSPPLARAREALLDDNAAFLGWCIQHDVRLDLALLHPWAHWITPESERRRFDTWFFLARSPRNQSASIRVGEAVDGDWMTLAGALSTQAEGGIVLSPPTLRSLEEMRSAPDVGALLQSSANRRLIPVMPQLLPGTQRRTLVIPGDPDYAGDDVLGVDGPSRFVLEGIRWISVDPTARSG
jgi:8-oxo-dGTP pyrophosphatase MutT (NUDIX family)